MKEKILEILNDCITCDPHTGNCDGKSEAAENISQLIADTLISQMNIINDCIVGGNKSITQILGELGLQEPYISNAIKKHNERER